MKAEEYRGEWNKATRKPSFKKLKEQKPPTVVLKSLDSWARRGCGNPDRLAARLCQSSEL